MLRRPRIASLLVVAGICACAPATASAALDVTRNATTGGIDITASGDVIERVTIDRATDGSLRIADAAAPVTSSDAACAADPTAGTVSCATTSGMPVTALLGGGADTLDARAATGIALRIDAGAGADRLRLGSSGMTVATGTDRLDTYDLSHATGDTTARFERAPARVVVRCGGCETPWAVTLPTQPRAVLLGTGDDVVDLRTWRARGTTTWTTGAGRDRLLGSPVHRSTFMAGADADVLVSWAAADRMFGGPGTDKLADLGGTGDLMDGGPDTDVMVSLDGRNDTMRGGAGRDMCPSARRAMRTCDSSGRVSGFEMNTYLPTQDPKYTLGIVGIRL